MQQRLEAKLSPQRPGIKCGEIMINDELVFGPCQCIVTLLSVQMSLHTVNSSQMKCSTDLRIDDMSISTSIYAVTRYST